MHDYEIGSDCLKTWGEDERGLFGYLVNNYGLKQVPDGDLASGSDNISVG
ncbi:hypothetical protein [Umezakia ovalisporum]|jgi:hypothetical protein|uniref:Uncharacterized protein n=2 Tax=Umezakia ovalisporum TaxID=75695 RepID=A0AA43H1A8_9CYAN|nr:hypothetical protein [Umezakia ovalisporum]MDH6058144.1 hypothetical protein [Umezakia ovalisporum FSS-43]MDH6065288.1 hypothetical protein [Umezakia ovalisporum FSS-62]MDH6066286.1 hypothetical protein [Umezakia ovalisporum APH033B]MDH6071845.1 hypothetical protein [Umezakia ovalisporum CobakiLakeA]MDH6073590.1 hypothetical protein [Umezakia ovalisporum CS-1034]